MLKTGAYCATLVCAFHLALASAPAQDRNTFEAKLTPEASFVYPDRFITTPSQNYMLGRDRMQDYLDDFESRNDRSFDSLTRKWFNLTAPNRTVKPFRHWNPTPDSPLKF